MGGHERTFLNYFKSAGISLYEANENIDNWSRLSLNVSSPPNDCCEDINKTPCN